DAEVFIESQGSGAISVEAGDYADIGIIGEGASVGALTVDAGDASDVHMRQLGTGALSVTVGDESHVHIEAAGEDGEYDISVTQTDSNQSSIILENISAAQNVSVAITAYGASEATIIKTFDTEEGIDCEGYWVCGEGDYDTHLAVVGSQGGIDTLTINAWRDAEGEVSAASSVSVVVDDTWAVAGEGEGADFTIDATDVVTLECEENAVFVNATQERDARLEIKGSATSANILL